MVIEMEAAIAAETDGPLSERERGELMHWQGVVHTNLRGFVLAGAALREIQKGRLYRERFKTFVEYAEAEFQLSSSRIYELIAASKTVEDVSGITDTSGLSTNAAYTLSKVAPAERAPVLDKARAAAGGAPPTAEGIKAAARDLFGAGPEPAAPGTLADDRDAAIAFLDAEKARREARANTPRLDRGDRPVPVPAEPAAPVRDGDEWYTPAEELARAREVMGGIDLDPASCPAAQAIVKATAYYGEGGFHADGLATMSPWRGRVWLNPPYSDPEPWIDRLIAEFDAGNVIEAIVLVNARTETEWFHRLWRHRHATPCFRLKRISFTAGDGGKSQTGFMGQVFFHLGKSVQQFERFIEVYASQGVISLTTR